jgi:hypothetical protein
MSFFKDMNGKDRRIRLTGPAIGKVTEATGIKLADAAGRGALEACADGEILTRVLWLLCAEPGETPDGFAESVASGEVFERARDAMQEAIVDFTPPSQRAALLKALATEKEVQTAAMALAVEKLDGEGLKDQLVDALRAGMDANIATILTQLRNAGNSPALPGSIRIAPPSAN